MPSQLVTDTTIDNDVEVKQDTYSSSPLTPQQDHYLKNQLLLLLFEQEFNAAWHDHTDFLANLKYPFRQINSNNNNYSSDSVNSNGNGASVHSVEDLLTTHADKYPVLKFMFINYVKTFPYFRDLDSKYAFSASDYREEMLTAEEAARNAVFNNGNSNSIAANTRSPARNSQILLLDHTNNNNFWRYKLQPFVNYLLSKNLSNSVDRLELTKRKKVNLRLFKLLVLFLNSSITTTKEESYYSNTDPSAVEPSNGKMDINKMTGDKLNQQISEDLEKYISELENCNENGNMEKNENGEGMMRITRKDLLDQLNNPPFINGYILQTIGVRKVLQADESSNGSKSGGFFSSINFLKSSKAVKTYEFILSVKYKISLDQLKYTDKHAYQQKQKENDEIEDESNTIIQEFIIFRSYADFKKLDAILKKNFPEVTLPKLPQKYKHSTLVKSIFENQADSAGSSGQYSSGNNDDDDDDSDDDKLYDRDGENGNQLLSSTGVNDLDEIFFNLDEFNEDSERILNYILTKNASPKNRSSSATANSIKGNLRKISGGKSSSAKRASNDDTSSGSMSNESFYSTNSKTTSNNNGTQSSVIDENVALPREKLRLLLNNYLKTLIKIPQVANSTYLKDFLFHSSCQQSQLTTEDKKDINYRKHLDYLTLKNQLIFQKKIYLINLKLKNELRTFKNIVLNSNNQTYLNVNYTPAQLNQYKIYLNLQSHESVLGKLLAEFKENKKITGFSPITKTFIKWIKLQAASFIYDLFFTSNSYEDKEGEEAYNAVSFELFSQIKRLHGLFPYTIVQSILRLTNPLLIIKRLLEFFLYQPPNILPSFFTGGGSDRDGENNNGHRSLIQVLFHNILSSDLSDINRRINQITEKLTKHYDKSYGALIENFKQFLRMNENKDLLKQEIIAQYKAKKKSDLILLVLFNDKLSRLSGSGSIPNFVNMKKQVFNSYEADRKLSKLKQKGEGQADSAKLVKLAEDAELYYDLKKLFQLLIRQNDKHVMNELWSESYLNNFLKDFLVIFFEPLVKIFAKNSLFKKVVKVFKNFVDDMLSLIEYLFDYIYVLNANEVILSIYLVISKYQDFVLEFIHETYLNDTDNFFENLISWVSGFLKFLKFFSGDANAGTKIDMAELIKLTGNIDLEKLQKEINLVIAEKKNAVLAQLMRTEINKKAAKAKNNSSGNNNINLVKENWDAVNGISFFDTSELGFRNNDIDELNGELEQLNRIDSNDSELVDEFLDESKNYYLFNQNGDTSGGNPSGNDSSPGIGQSETSKLVNGFKVRLEELLKVYQQSNSI